MASVRKIRNQHIKNITQANQNKCGSGENGIVRLEDGTTVCVRYGTKYFLIFAEALAFYLSRLLGMDNVPEVVISRINGSSEQWKGSDFLKLWQENVEVALIKWLNNASSVPFMPQAIQDAYKLGTPIKSENIGYYPHIISEPTAIAEVIQWGTLIIFDNLIGHYDRLIHYQPYKERGTGIRSINSSLFNSLQSPNGKIWLIDNESAFFYQSKFRDPKYNYIRLLRFHDKMLKTMCIFQLSFVVELKKLSKFPSAFQHLWDYASSYEPLFQSFKKDYRFSIFAKLFNARLADIIAWIDHCKSLSLDK